MISSENKRHIGGIMEQLKRLDKRWLIAIGLIAVAEAWRIYNYYSVLAPGAELVTAAALAAAAFLPRRAALVVPLSIMAIGDIILGNSPIMAFTWTAFAVIGLSGLLLRRLHERKGVMLGASIVAGMGSALFFYLFTNFGVWLISGMYAPTWAGLMQSYAMGLPFYRMNVIGNLIAVPVVFVAFLYGPAVVASLRSRLGLVTAR